MTEKKLTEAEIMKALECCASKIQMCKDCSMPKEIQDDCKCMETLSENVIDLINRKNAENAVLNRKLTDAYLMINKLRGDSV